MNIRTISALAVLLAGSLAAAPQAIAQTGFYLGGNFGVSRANIDANEANQDLISLGATSASTTVDQSGTGFKGYGGYAFTPNIAIEFGYFDLGKFTVDSTVSPPGTAHADLKFKGFNVDVVGSIPVGTGFSLFGRVGVINTKQDVSVSSTGSIVTLTPSDSFSKTSWKAGIGVEYMITGGLGVRAEGEVYNVPDGPDDKANIGLLSVGLLYRF
jgi:OOP family OmpA-OmpF porin